MPVSQSRLRKVLHSIRDLFKYHMCIHNKTSTHKKSEEKLLNIFHELTVGVSKVFNDYRDNDFEEFLRCDRVSSKINVLSEQIGQVRTLYRLWKSGYNLDPKELSQKCQNLNFLVDCIRDEVFYAYLQLPPEKKLELLQRDNQVSAMFSVLGLLENEVTGMVKTLMPEGEMIKLIRHLLRPELSNMIYKRASKSLHGYYGISDCIGALQWNSDKPAVLRTCLANVQYGNENIHSPASPILPEGVSSCRSVSLSDLSQMCDKSSQSSAEGSIDTRDIGVFTEDVFPVSQTNDVLLSNRRNLRLFTEPIEKKSLNGVSFWRVAADLITDSPVNE